MHEKILPRIGHGFVKGKERSIIAKLTPRVYSTMEAALDTIVKEIESGR